jgi:hypothetical protein
VIKSRRMRWAEHVAWMEKIENHEIFWLENLMAREHLEDLGIHEKITLEWILGK